MNFSQRGMNPMASSQNCTCQQSSVNCLDRRNISVKQDALHSCWAYDALLCMSEIVCYKSAEGEFAGCLLSVVSEAEARSRLAEIAAGHEFKHKACRSVAMGRSVYIPIPAE